MFGVYLMYCTRKLKSPFVGESFALVLLIGSLFIFVSVPSVLSNMFSAGNLYNYFIVAFSNTDFLVQSIIILAGAIAIFSLRNFGNILELSRSNSAGRVTHS